jgi:hypothetical protein
MDGPNTGKNLATTILPGRAAEASEICRVPLSAMILPLMDDRFESCCSRKAVPLGVVARGGFPRNCNAIAVQVQELSVDDLDSGNAGLRVLPESSPKLANRVESWTLPRTQWDSLPVRCQCGQRQVGCSEEDERDRSEESWGGLAQLGVS